MSISRVEELLRKVLPLILVSFASLALASESLIVVSGSVPTVVEKGVGVVSG